MHGTTAMDEWDDDVFSFIQKPVHAWLLVATSNMGSASPVPVDITATECLRLNPAVAQSIHQGKLHFA